MAEVLERLAELTHPSPMMQQYIDTKRDYPDTVLMYRLGDFFEMFFEDAVAVSRALELTLTGRDCGDGLRAAMCGVPFHKLDLYIGKLIEQGFRVAVCEQVEDPALAKGLVKREIVRVVTPGTVTDGNLLNDRRNNYLAALYPEEEGFAVAFADISTGQVSATRFLGEDALVRLKNEFGVYTPKEILYCGEEGAAPELFRYCRETLSAMINGDPSLFRVEDAFLLAKECFGKEAEALSDRGLLAAVGALLSYIQKTQMCEPDFVRELTVYEGGKYMELDFATRRNLEITESMRTKERKGSLLWVLDSTQTAMGARLLRSWLTRPLLSPGEIALRQKAVGSLCEDLVVREELRGLLDRVLDLERLTAKVAYGTANAKDLRAICQSIASLPKLREKLGEAGGSLRLREIHDSLDTLEDLYELLDRAFVEEPPFSVREGGMIREGYHTDVDYLRSIQSSGKEWVTQIEVQEKEVSGIKNLKVGYNKVFGYYIEVSKSQVSMVPDRYIRKQTLTNCERYITQELKDMEATVLGAQDKLCALEYALFTEIRDHIAKESSRIQKTAALLAETDVYAALADTAVKNHYVCPEVDLSDVIEIRDGRHPVVERFIENSYFVPNDTELDTQNRRLMLITGPNMAGKSTYMRQVALIVILAQIGSFVPAKEARIGIVDKVFTRVGASDDLASGQSTFMLEMTEVANILKNATRRSLIVYDEVGRGTSTYDGMSIAKAVAEYTLGKKLGAKTLFATHYHELTVMETEFTGVMNYNVAAKKRGDSITFLRKIVKGATDDSYGIDVAKLAGVPSEVVTRARRILSDIEAGNGASAPRSTVSQQEAPLPDMLGALERSEAEEAAERIRAVDINTLTPIEAINLVYELKKLVK